MSLVNWPYVTDVPAARLMAWGEVPIAPTNSILLRAWLCYRTRGAMFGRFVAQRGYPRGAGGGARYEVRNRVVLCRCGQSYNNPTATEHMYNHWCDEIAQQHSGEELPDGELVVEMG